MFSRWQLLETQEFKKKLSPHSTGWVTKTRPGLSIGASLTLFLTAAPRLSLWLQPAFLCLLNPTEPFSPEDSLIPWSVSVPDSGSDTIIFPKTDRLVSMRLVSVISLTLAVTLVNNYETRWATKIEVQQTASKPCRRHKCVHEKLDKQKHVYQSESVQTSVERTWFLSSRAYPYPWK